MRDMKFMDQATNNVSKKVWVFFLLLLKNQDDDDDNNDNNNKLEDSLNWSGV